MRERDRDDPKAGQERSQEVTEKIWGGTGIHPKELSQKNSPKSPRDPKSLPEGSALTSTFPPQRRRKCVITPLPLPYSNMAAPCLLPHPLLPAARAVPYSNMAAAKGVLVQYVVLRGDLARPPRSWPLGAVVAQGCHAALAAVHGYREHPDTGAYLEQGGAMRTVVLEVAAAPRGMMGTPR